MRAFPFVLAALLVVPGLALAASYPDPQKAPRYFDSGCIQKFDRRFVYDFVGVMDAEHASLIEGAACEVYANTSAHFVLAAVPDTGDESLEGYALHLFETWGIGSKDVNDGVLLLYVEHYNLSGRGSAVRVEVGYGLEGTINAHVANDAIRLMRDTKDRSIEAGDSDAYARSLALAVGADYLLQTLAESYHDGRFPPPEPQDTTPPWWTWLVVAIVVLALVQALARAAAGPRGWGYRSGSSSAWKGALAGAFANELMRRGGGGGGGFGGGGFGGGRSGGGGGSGGF